MKQSEWDRRIRRAEELSSTYPFATEGLRFYTRIAAFQRAFFNDLQSLPASSVKPPSSASLRDDLDLFVLLPQFAGYLALVQQIAPAPLASAAGSLAQKGSTAWQRAIEDFWHGGELSEHSAEDSEAGPEAASLAGEARYERFLAWIFLQPYAEFLAARRPPLHVDGAPRSCPVCGGPPLVGVLRREGDGARKSLICMLCAHEWNFRRIYCPSCGEEREPQMGFYSAPEIAHVRVDVCDSCHTYLKTVDLTKLGLAVPVVDELATIPLDLWARDHGYEKLQLNLLGT